MTPAPAPHGERLQQWLLLLDTAGFRIGVRERLVVLQLLNQQAADGRLAGHWAPMLEQLAPLLCTTPRQQAEYHALLARFVAQQGESPDALRRARQAPPAAPPARLGAWWWGLAALCAAAALVLALRALREQGLPLPPPEPQVVQLPQAASAPAPAASTLPVYLVPGPLPLQPVQREAAAWARPLRLAVMGLGVLAALGLAAAAWSRRRRDLVLSQVRSHDDVEQHVLHAGEVPRVQPHPALARSVARALRQRVAGDTEALDIKATLAATVRAAGGFSPRWRALRRTPEYLVLVDRRHGSDHHAWYSEALVRALVDAGVTAQLWLFEGTPDDGCWPQLGSRRDAQGRGQRTPFAELAARHAGQRLLVLAGAEALRDPASGQPRRWAKALSLFAQRAWLTPLPINAWGAAEDLVDTQGFLLLPAQEGALPALGAWLGSEQLLLDVPADWPLAYPELLHGDGLAWVTRQLSPPPEALEELMFQLRTTLGPERFQWLCACAVFPAIAPAMTLALGRALPVADDRALTLGFTALSALPWFRHGSMPAWLRQQLMDQLKPEVEARLRRAIDARLTSALQRQHGDELATLATARRKAWWRQAQGPARDVLLASFMQQDEVSRLMQRLPRAAQRLLFRQGLPLLGLRDWPMGAGAAVLALAVGAATPWWPSPLVTVPRPALQPIGRDIAPPGADDLLGFSLDGRSLIGQQGQTQGAPALAAWDVRTGRLLDQELKSVSPAQRAGSSAYSVGREVHAVIDSQGRVTLQDARDQALGLPLNGPDEPMAQVAFSPDGRRLAARARTGALRLWGQPFGPRTALVGCAGDGAVSAAARALVDRVAASPVADHEVVAYTARAWQALYRDAPPTIGQITYADEAQRPAAEAWRQFLVEAAGTNGAPPYPWTARRGAAPDDTLVVGLCAGNQPADDNPAAALPAIPGLTPQQVLALDARVSAMFSADADTRVRATEGLMKDWNAFSDALPLALQRAWRFQQRGVSPGSPEMEGIYNTLMLANAADPATLNREADTLTRLLAAAAAHGDKTARLADTLRATLTAGRQRKPLVYIQYSGAAQKPLAERVMAALRQAGYSAPGVEDAGPRLPSRAELRLQGVADRRTARELATLVGSTLGQVPVQRSITPRARVQPPTDTYELWLAAPADAVKDDPNLVRIESCRPLIRADVTARVDALAQQAEGVARKLGLRTERVDVSVQADGFSNNSREGLTIDHPADDANAQRVASALARGELSKLGFRLRALASDPPRKGSPVSIRVCGTLPMAAAK